MNKQVIDKIRRYQRHNSNVTDIEIAKHYEGTLLHERVKITIAFEDLKAEVMDSRHEWLKRFMS